ncbi:interleukin-23 subunit alpha [Coturnix japonica]|uniref:interleukin-23 subunit alpha n=1 Tax=Coturnix japonica TaxID=93934 RepID=UPI000777DE4F|nr:interleukin-23 subunit alpha [Coturnix japonica]
MVPFRRLLLVFCLPAMLLPPAVPFPTPGTDWAACRDLSQRLSRLLGAMKESHRVLDGVRLGGEEDSEGDCAPRIRCSDACDPSTLDTNSTNCLRRILQGLQHYQTVLSSDIFATHPQPELKAVLDELLGLVQVPFRSCQTPPPPPTDLWARPLLQHNTLERLRSFTAVMSRVFTHGASTR